MKTYSPEIIKQAEELVEKHKKFADPETLVSWDKPFANAVRAAIVSCEFALKGLDTVRSSKSVPFELRTTQILEYLKSLI